MYRSNYYLVVMAGGSGTRFWPKSTSKRPKQLLSFSGDRTDTLLVQTLSRFDGIVAPENRYVVTTRMLKDSIAEQAPGVSILAEPQGRNTAACVYWAARVVAQKDPKGIMLVMPSDHYIPKEASFRATVNTAAEWAAANDHLVTLGIKPTRPETGYGYLRMGSQMGGPDSPRRVEAFVEKPNIDKARVYVQFEQYLWIGGMFIWRADVILDAFDRFMPEMKKAWEKAEENVDVAYPNMTATSIDYGVMEKVDNVVTYPLDCGWDDLGSWLSLEGLALVLGAKKGGSTVTGGELLAVQSEGNIIDTPGKVVALLGISDLIVVEHNDVIMIAPKDRSQDIRMIVDQVKKIKPELA